jgi:hypothetical protein
MRGKRARMNPLVPDFFEALEIEIEAATGSDFPNYSVADE